MAFLSSRLGHSIPRLRPLGVNARCQKEAVKQRDETLLYKAVDRRSSRLVPGTRHLFATLDEALVTEHYP